MSELTISPELLHISAEVKEALENNKPVVALESTIISHGMPFPQNAQTAIEVEETIRKHGAVPATIAIIKGVMKVGLTKEEIELLGREGHSVAKVSRRDLPFVVAAGLNGATTVASTMIIAALAGIKVFATGGIGGVHRGAEHTFDISADLQELAHGRLRRGEIYSRPRPDHRISGNLRCTVNWLSDQIIAGVFLPYQPV